MPIGCHPLCIHLWFKFISPFGSTQLNFTHGRKKAEAVEVYSPNHRLKSFCPTVKWFLAVIAELTYLHNIKMMLWNVHHVRNWFKDMKLTSQSGILIKIKQKDKNSSSTYHKDKIMRWIKKNNSDVENVKVIYFLQISKGKIDLFQSTVVGKKSFSTAWPLNDSSLKRKKKEREKSCVWITTLT